MSIFPPHFHNQTLIDRSRAAVWHPCTQMKHHDQFPLIPIARAEGVWLYDHENHRYLDAVSSWWVNLFGHANPRINAAIRDQLDTLEHVMLAGFTHEPVVALSERLAALSGLGHAFYGSDGASAVEIALKMSFHAWRNAGKTGKKRFVSLAGSYHGETIGALSVTDVAIFRDAYGPLLQNNLRVPCPTLTDDETALAALAALLQAEHSTIAALIVEPLVQGAAGMRMYTPAALTRMHALCAQYDVHFIADEIMTGFGRTGTMFAVEQANIRPDFLCLSKGITGGYLPLSCVLTTDDIYRQFYDDDVARGFLHSHSYTGSALACRAALATLDIFESDNVIAQNRSHALQFDPLTAPLRAHPAVTATRQLGMIWAFDVAPTIPDFAKRFFAASIKREILLRPINHTIYFMPPYIITAEQFAFLVEQTIATLNEVLS